MPRNSSGTYALPAGNPVVSNTLIQSTWANTTLSDVSTAMTDSLDRNGRGAMLAPLKNIDGTAVAPSITFASEGTLGAYRVSAGVLGIAAGGALVLSISAAGLTFTNPLILPLGTAAAPAVTFVANTNTGFYSPGTNQVALSTNGVQRLAIDATGATTLSGSLVLPGAQVTFPTTGANLITASHAAGTLALQTGGANTRLSIDAAGLVTIAQTLGIGGAPALGKLQVFGGAVVVDNAQSYAAKTSGGALCNILGLDASNNLVIGAGGAVATLQFATGGTVRGILDGNGSLVIGAATSPSYSGQKLTAKLTTDPAGINTPNGLAIARAANDSLMWLGYATTPDGFVISSTYSSTGAYKPLIFATSDTERVRIDTSGNLLVGTTANSWGAANRGLIEINGSSSALLGLKVGNVQGAYYLHDGTNASLVSNTNGSMQIGTNGTIRLTINANGSSTFAGSASTTPSVIGNAAGSFSLDTSKSNVITVTAVGNITGITLTNLTDGQSINLFITQDGTGSRTLAGLTAANGYVWPGGVQGVLSTAAGAVDLIVMTYRAATAKLYCTIVKAFS